METPIAATQAGAQAVAEEYRNRGYEVVLEPSPRQIPDFLAGYRPDLIAHRDNESVVVEITSRRDLMGDPKAREMARLIQSQPGWSFELVVVREEENPFVDARSFERDDIIQGIDEAERLNTTGSTEAALLLAWASSEAAVRLLAEEEGVELQRLTPVYVLKQAVSEGLISRSDFNLLTRAMPVRNAVAHGFRAADLDPSMVQELVRVTRHLLGHQPARP